MIYRNFLFLMILFFGTINAGCSAAVVESQQSEEKALESLRQMTKNGELPPESVVAGIEARFPNTRAAALARLLRAHILLSGGDALNAAGLLSDAKLIEQKTSLADYALWLRGQALAKAGKTAEAASQFEKIISNFPNSLRVREARLNLAQIRSQMGETERVLSVLQDLTAKNDGAALLIIAQTYEKAGRTTEAAAEYRKIYFFAPASAEAVTAENYLKTAGFDFNSATKEDFLARADALFAGKKFADSANFFQIAANNFPNSLTVQQQLNRGIALANAKRTNEAALVFSAIPLSAGEIKAIALSESVENYVKAKLWAQAKQTIEELRRNFPNNPITPKTYVETGMAAREAKNFAEESFYLRTALTTYPNAIDVGKAQFELAWLDHESGNFQTSSQSLIEHLARYAGKDTTYRGKAGYWAARDSERAGKLAEACFLYEAMQARYDANWYGYLSKQKLVLLQSNRRCPTTNNFTPESLVGKAANNLKTVTVAPETSTSREVENIKKADELGAVALFDWSLQELNQAAKTASNSPRVNLGLAKLFRYRGDNVSALLALAKSYPDYSQMKPEEMTKEEWDIFYPLNYWKEIKRFSQQRNLDPYQVAGLIRQESVFNTRAKSAANAYGLMQLLLPTARMVARKYGALSPGSAEDLYNPALNIELGTGYMRDQLDNYGRIEYLAVAYNAGPGRVVQWRKTLPLEMDEFVEEIPFKETKAYVQGVIRNSAQYRRLYDEDGNFKSNVGTKSIRSEIDSKPREQFAQEFPEIILDGQNAEE